MPSFWRYVRARSLFHDRKTASIARRSWCHGSSGTSATPTIDRKLVVEALATAARRTPRCRTPRQPGASVASFRPRFRIVSIIPGIDTGAPERTLTSSGSAGSPKRRPTAASTRAIRRAELVVEPGRPAVGQERPAGRGRDHEAGRHRQAELARHHPEVGRLAADERLGLLERRRGAAASSANTRVIAVVEPSASPASARQTRSGRQRQVADDDTRSRRGRPPRRPARPAAARPRSCPSRRTGPGPSSFSMMSLSIRAAGPCSSGSGSRWRRGSGSGPSSSKM